MTGYLLTLIGEDFFALSLKNMKTLCLTDSIQDSEFFNRTIKDSSRFIGFTKLKYTPLLTINPNQEAEELFTGIIDTSELLFQKKSDLSSSSKLVVYDVGDQYLSFVIDDAIYIEYLKENGIKKTAFDMPYGAFCEGTIEFNQNLFTIINLIDYYQTISEGNIFNSMNNNGRCGK
ncbi:MULTISPECIES: hypothetical protein [unclassified Niallia]|uniref:hypothetical protein n=1 Tax=unclassified Niallia TaxID=2837522 RepID=UPI001EDC3F7E|nr:MULTISPECIES: hypothetical protein [unclassified Niallia]MDL0435900.1 hypothetical protein [Niallia sp. SS-2023]UPO86238.1 hypothetical protein L8T27_011490 [Niallia sp. Man26]